MLSLYEALSYKKEESIIQEGFFDRFKKKSRWQRFKDTIKNNKGKLLGGALASFITYKQYGQGKEDAKHEYAKNNEYEPIYALNHAEKKKYLPVTVNPNTGKKEVLVRDNSDKHHLLQIDKEVNESFLGFGKKPSRWQRFKDTIKNNKKSILAGIVGTGLAQYGAYKLGKRQDPKLKREVTLFTRKGDLPSVSIHYVDDKGNHYGGNRGFMQGNTKMTTKHFVDEKDHKIARHDSDVQIRDLMSNINI